MSKCTIFHALLAGMLLCSVGFILFESILLNKLSSTCLESNLYKTHASALGLFISLLVLTVLWVQCSYKKSVENNADYKVPLYLIFIGVALILLMFGLLVHALSEECSSCRECTGLGIASFVFFTIVVLCDSTNNIAFLQGRHNYEMCSSDDDDL